MKKPSMHERREQSSLFGGSFGYLESLYEDYCKDPSSVPAAWQERFKTMQAGVSSSEEPDYSALRAQFEALAKQPAQMLAVQPGQGSELASRAHALFKAYRAYGHTQAKIDPLGLQKADPKAELSLNFHGLSQADLSADIAFEGQTQSLKTWIEHFQAVYCGSAGIEVDYLTNTDERLWLQKRIETAQGQYTLSADQKKFVFKNLMAAEGMEKFLARKYVGQKRFSLEGGETLIPLLNTVIRHGAGLGVNEVLIGMAHRGRLSVMLNVMGMSAKALCDSFEGAVQDKDTSGDVKYHWGYSSDISVNGQDVHLSLAFNPSHLEIVSSVVMGSARSKQVRRPDSERPQVLPIQIHGDASFAGQGCVAESFNFAGVDAYNVQGSVHVVVNNQVGFTTLPTDARTGSYSTNVARSIEAPIFHVNADDPEAVVFFTELATAYRQQFKKDVVIDLICYRRLGHNEADEPSATQPVMYRTIRQHPSTFELYSKACVDQGVYSQDDVKAHVAAHQKALANGETLVDIQAQGLTQIRRSDWEQYSTTEGLRSEVKKPNRKTLTELAKQLVALPEGFECQRQVAHMHDNRIKMAASETDLMWGFAETLAYASIMNAGHSVRLVGQDAQRGTFSHRHATLHDINTGESYAPLGQFEQPYEVSFQNYNSVLSEEVALAYEYGYACSDPKALVIWEAQFGDFANGAQVVMDQFISSGWQKWQRKCGLVMMLPHGYEGMGPEHSSARLERYLQLTAQHNIQVCVPSTPAQIFHLLRRQVLTHCRTPLVIMTPKSLLRHPKARSTMEALEKGKFQWVIDADKPAKKTSRVVLCSGKVYYELQAACDEQKLDNIALVRIEQLYPFPYDRLREVLAQYPKADVVWCQEEPQNQGAWTASRHRLEASLAKGQRLGYAGRPPSASPAVGYPRWHKEEQEALIKAALTGKVQADNEH